MASALSLCLYCLPSSVVSFPSSVRKGLHYQNPVFGLSSCTWYATIGSGVQISSYMINCSYSVYSGSHLNLLASNTHLSVPLSSILTEQSTTYVVLSGFWVGPETEDDGWGYIEAIVTKF